MWRTSGAVTLPTLSSCYHAYLSSMHRQLNKLARLHILVDLSLQLGATESRGELRRQVAAHEKTLASSMPFASPFVYTVADIVEAFPLVQWPLPGQLRPLNDWHNDTAIWYTAHVDKLHRQGLNSTRWLQGQGNRGMTVSNLISYFIHEPSLILWLRHQPLKTSTRSWNGDGARYVWVIEDDAALVGSTMHDFLARFSPEASVDGHLALLREGSRTHIRTSDLISVFQPHKYVDEFYWLYRNDIFDSMLPGKVLHRKRRIHECSNTLCVVACGLSSSTLCLVAAKILSHQATDIASCVCRLGACGEDVLNFTSKS